MESKHHMNPSGILTQKYSNKIPQSTQQHSSQQSQQHSSQQSQQHSSQQSQQHSSQQSQHQQQKKKKSLKWSDELTERVYSKNTGDIVGQSTRTLV